ncbi:MAG: MFS transporter [Candidatus Aenigmarchaeota archaeon]|nr:MFS transporter [Candidatus Aenigmarchaeota archaeon]
MALERFKLFGRGKKRDDLQGEERSILGRDLHALRVVRTIMFPRVNWKTESKRSKRSHYKRIKRFLEELPSEIQNRNTQAININQQLAAQGILPQHALEGAEYMLKGKVKEVKLQKFSTRRTPTTPPPTTPTPTGTSNPFCPHCSKSDEKYELVVAGNDPTHGIILHCRRCWMKFHFGTNGRLERHTPHGAAPAPAGAPDAFNRSVDAELRCPQCMARNPNTQASVIIEEFKTQEGTLFRFQCTDPSCNWRAELTEQEYDQWLKQRKTVKRKNARALRAHLYQQLQNKYGVSTTWDATANKWVTTGKASLGKRTEYEEAKKSVDQKMGEIDTNISKHGAVNVSEDDFKHDLIKNNELNSFGFHGNEVGRFSKKIQESYKESADSIKKEVKEGKEKQIADELDSGHKNAFNRFVDKTGHGVKGVVFSIFALSIGIFLAAVFDNTYLLWSFGMLAAHLIFPDPEENEKVENHKQFSLGSMMATRDNRANVGIAFVKAVTKVFFLVFLTLGIYDLQVPLANLLVLFVAFGSYFSMKIEFAPDRPYEFIESASRMFFAIFIAFYIFGLSSTSGIFGAPELGWLSLAFFFVAPVASEKKSVARAIGFMAKATGESSNTIHLVIFIFTMGAFFVSGGFGFTGDGSFATLFFIIWLIGLFSGLSTPPETRPWMGVIILVIGFLAFGFGEGQQTMGTAFFGEWWPTVYTTVSGAFGPLGDVMAGFQNTFGQTFLLLTSPTEFAKQITQGNYGENDLVQKGAYGLEITRFDVQSIYIDEPFVIQIDLTNKGIYHAKNIKVELLTDVEKFKIGKDASNLKNPMTFTYDDKYEKPWYRYTISVVENDDLYEIYGMNDVEMQDAVSIFLVGKMECADFLASKWKSENAAGKDRTIREKYIPFVLNVTYEYESESSLQLEFISDEEWKRLSEMELLHRGPRLSTVSTSPASLNLGSMDQPIKHDSPFYVGFNLTSTWPQKTKITNAVVNFHVPTIFIVESNKGKECTIIETPVGNVNNDVQTYTFNLKNQASKAVFCNYNKISPPITVPKKTYTITADATYTFSKWEQKDTLFNFDDVCTTTAPPTSPGRSNYCSYQKEKLRGCNLGESECSSDDECCQNHLQCPIDESFGQYLYDIDGDGNKKPLKCIDKICCPEGSNAPECTAAYNEWMSQIKLGNEIDGKKIWEEYLKMRNR